MNLIRTSARMMLASYFVVNGAKQLANPSKYVDEAKPVVNTFVPLAQKVAPENYVGYIPTQEKTLVRLNGAAQIVGGIGLATGLGRRLGALVLAAATVPHIAAVAMSKTEQGAVKRSHLLQNVALLGGVLLASQDLQGKPSLAWRAGQQQRMLSRSIDQKSTEVSKKADKMTRSARKQAKQTRKDLEKQAKQAQKNVKKALGN